MTELLDTLQKLSYIVIPPLLAFFGYHQYQLNKIFERFEEMATRVEMQKQYDILDKLIYSKSEEVQQRADRLENRIQALCDRLDRLIDKLDR